MVHVHIDMYIKYRPAHKILDLMAYAQKPPWLIQLGKRSSFGLSLPLLPYFVKARSQGSDKAACKCSLI